MADIIVDVSLPNPLSVNVTSPTQALATNVSVPGPQGPIGPRGFTPLINGITGDAILFSGKDGIIISTDQSINTIYISGNSGYFEGKINSLTTNLELTGNNLYSLLINFSGNLDANYATDLQLYNTGSTLDNKINSLSGWSASAVNLTSTGATLITNLFNTGSNLNTKIDNLSGYVNAQDNNISTNLYNTGSTLDIKINTLSGYTDSQDTSISNNLITTGSTLDTKINDLSGYVNTQDNSISNNLISTGSTLNNKINSLSGAAVLKFDDQIIYGTKYFNENVYIHNLYVTGDEFIANVTNSYIESPYLLLNLTGGAIDGGIFFVTGSGFTGINDYGPIIGFNHSNKFKIGVARRSDDLSFLPDIASVQQIEAYSGVANNTFSTISNLTSTGVSLGSRIDTLTTNLTLSGSTLDSKINALSGWSASAANLYTTGSTLDLKINSLSGWSASAVNLASTGSTLNNRINNLSGYINSTSSNIVFTTGNQIKSGRLAIGDTIVDESYAYTLSVQSNNNNTWLEILNHSGSNKGVFFGIEGNDFEQYNWQAGDIKFFTSEIFSNGIERLRIKNDGKVGIGTSAPSEKLEVAGNLKIGGPTAGSAILYMYDSPNDAYNTAIWTDSELQFTQTTDSSNLTIGFSQQGNTLVSNGSTLKLPAGKNDFIAMDAEVIHKTGNETISGVKTFIGNHNISGNLNVTGNSNIRGTLDVTGLVVSGLGSSFILKSPNNQTSVSFDGTINGNAGALFSNWLYSSNVSSRGDDNFDHYYGGGGERSIRYIKSSITRAILDSNGNFGIGSGISSVPSRFYVSGNSVLQGNLTVSGNVNISGNYDIYSQIENVKKLAIAYAIAL